MCLSGCHWHIYFPSECDTKSFNWLLTCSFLFSFRKFKSKMSVTFWKHRWRTAGRSLKVDKKVQIGRGRVGKLIYPQNKWRNPNPFEIPLLEPIEFMELMSNHAAACLVPFMPDWPVNRRKNLDKPKRMEIGNYSVKNTSNAVFVNVQFHLMKRMDILLPPLKRENNSPSMFETFLICGETEPALICRSVTLDCMHDQVCG